MKIKNIKWDIEEEDKYYTEYLPTELDINLDEINLEDIENEDELYSAVGDYLSDLYGYCHYDFEIELEKSEIIDLENDKDLL